MTTATSSPGSSYYGSSPLMRALRLALGAVQRVWPALGVRAACRLFSTPLPPKWINRRQVPDAHWRHERWSFENANLGVYTPRGPIPSDAPLVLLVHGWGGHAGQLLAVAEAVAREGSRPVLLEMPAHGRSGAMSSNLPQFARAIDYAAAQLVQQGGARLQAVVAHSMGANALAYAASRGLHTERLVLLAPPASAHDFTRYFADVFGLSERTRAGMQRRVEARQAILMSLFEPAAIGPRVAQATLIVHDRDDRINRFADGEAYRDAIAGARLVATQGLGHRRILKDPSVLREVADFIASR